MKSTLDRCYSIADLRSAAKQRLPKGVFEFIDLGTQDGLALAENRVGFDCLKLVTKFMVDLTERDMGTDVFGTRANLPLAISPMGGVGFAWPAGELAMAKAAAKAGIPYTLSVAGLSTMEQIATEAGGRLWFQIYMWDEVELSYDILRRARDLGLEALVVTIDGALGRLREHNERNGFAVPFKPTTQALLDMVSHPRWLTGMLGHVARAGMPKLANYPAKYQRIVTLKSHLPYPHTDKAMTWADVAKIREFWPGKLIIKGVLSTEDAQYAVENGADAVLVSNHGGRAMDSAISSIGLLPEIVATVDGRARVMLDSGVRRGSDVAKALALGADMVFIGRAGLYGLAVGGQAGVEKAIEILHTELEKTMAFLGCRKVEELSPAILARSASRTSLR